MTTDKINAEELHNWYSMGKTH